MAWRSQAVETLSSRIEVPMNAKRSRRAMRAHAQGAIAPPSTQPSCKLCLLPRKLIRSHVIPEFVYKRTYDSRHQAIHINRASGQGKPLQKGLREPLLCGDCEQLLSGWEHYFAESWVHGDGPRGAITTDHVVVANLDVTKFRLFHLSILWRAGVSSLGPFAQVQLGTHEEPLRQALLAKSVPPPEMYQLFAFALVAPATRRILDDVIISPVRRRVDGRTCYVFMFAGCVWNYMVSNRPLEKSSPLNAATLTSTGGICLPVVDLNSFSPLDRTMLDHLGVASKRARNP